MLRTERKPGTPRLEYSDVAPEVYQAMVALERAVRQGGLDPRLLELVRIRSSQLNHCAHCLDIHTRSALAKGETPLRLAQIAAWRESNVFSPKERASLAWTDAVTLVAETEVPDPAYDEAREQFSEKELVYLTLAIIAINGWNRLAVGFRLPPEPE